MSKLTDSMNEARAAIEADAVGLTNGEGGPLVDNVVFRVGLKMLTPSEPIAVEHASGVRVAARGLRMFINAAKQRAEW